MLRKVALRNVGFPRESGVPEQRRPRPEDGENRLGFFRPWTVERKTRRAFALTAHHADPSDFAFVDHASKLYSFPGFTIEDVMLDDRRGEFVPCEECLWRRANMFKPMNAGDIAALKAFKKDHIYVPAGRTLIRRDTKPAVFYTLYDGWAFQYMTVNAGRQITRFCLPGDVVALQVPLYGRAPYNVQTLTDASLCVFEADRIEELFQAHPRLGYELTRIVATEAALADMHLATIGRRNAEARVAYLLCELHTRLKHRRMARENGCVLPLTQEHIADALGLSTVHVSRMLKSIHDDGLARFDRGQLTIHDFAGLCTRAEINSELDIPKPSLF